VAGQARRQRRAGEDHSLLRAGTEAALLKGPRQAVLDRLLLQAVQVGVVAAGPRPVLRPGRDGIRRLAEEPPPDADRGGVVDVVLHPEGWGEEV
jgi:hypothetical protein